MKTLRWLSMPLLLIATTAVSLGQRTVKDQLAEANEMNDEGENAKAVAILDPLLHDPPQSLGEGERGVAWNVLGAAYHGLGNVSEARRCYERSIQILREVPDARSQYASVVDNMGSIEMAMGDLDAAKRLRTKARKLYEMEGDHDGLAAADNNLAMIALKQNDLREARKKEEEAFHQAAYTNDLKLNTFASMHVVMGAIKSAEGNPKDAITSYGKAIDLMNQRAHQGPNQEILATTYGLRGSAFAEIHDSSRAIADSKLALVLFEQTSGKYSVAYLSEEIRYAQILRTAGSNEEAVRLEQTANDGLAALNHQQCNGCTISAEAFSTRF
jgi:tetratricopeptide (TPR) repeat protein